MECQQCGKELDPFGHLAAYIKEEGQYREFCGITCHEEYMKMYPKYSIRELQRILKNLHGAHGMDTTPKFLEFVRTNNKRVKELIK